MKVALFVILALLLLGVLSGLAWKRIKSRAKKVDLVAKSNHKSLRSFHYGPASVIPAQEPATAAPPLAPDNPLSLLMPEEDFRAKEEMEIAGEAARVEAAQAAEREEAQVALPAADELVPAAEPKALDPGPLLASSRHAPGASVNVFDVLGLLGNDAPAPVPVTVPVEAPQPVAAMATGDNEPVADALYDNPVSPTSTARTKNDAANTQAALTLRQRNRAALQARLAPEKTAMAAFTTDTKQAR